MTGEPRKFRGHRWYASVYAKVIEPSDRKTMGPLRRFAAGEAHGRVLEPGAGTGANLQHYDWAAVESLDLTEPDPYMRAYLQKKLDGLPSDVRARIQLNESVAEQLPFPDATFDVAVVTLVLCSVRDTAASIAELRRVLKTDGELRVVEHVAAQGAWGGCQRLIQPVYGWVSGECQLHRDTERLLEEGGFSVQVSQRMKLGVPIFPAFAATAKPRR
jgi:SAM-dependent methyltransferase